jgi:hypothetical protein
LFQSPLLFIHRILEGCRSGSSIALSLALSLSLSVAVAAFNAQQAGWIPISDQAVDTVDAHSSSSVSVFSCSIRLNSRTHPPPPVVMYPVLLVAVDGRFTLGHGFTLTTSLVLRVRNLP